MTECHFISEVFAQEAKCAERNHLHKVKDGRAAVRHSPCTRPCQSRRHQLVSSALLPGRLQIPGIMQNPTTYVPKSIELSTL